MRLCNFLLLFTFLAFQTGWSHATDPKRPNFLIIYADDLGYGETGIQGCKDIPTPFIDSIAKNGLRCTHGYVAATYCSPSRAGLMTGKYPTRFGHEFNAIARQSGLSLKETTIADRLKTLGYATAVIGKWHLGDPAEYHPTKRGFDEFYGTLANTPFFHPTKFIDSKLSPEVKAIDEEDFYTTEKYPWIFSIETMTSLGYSTCHSMRNTPPYKHPKNTWTDSLRSRTRIARHLRP
jgi:arylsulfatase A-like enzyme